HHRRPELAALVAWKTQSQLEQTQPRHLLAPRRKPRRQRQSSVVPRIRDAEYGLVARKPRGLAGRLYNARGLMHRSLLRDVKIGYGAPRAAYDRWLTNLPGGSERCLLHIQSLPSILLLLARRKRQSGRMSTKKGLIGILTGGGDVPGLNPAIRAVTIRALREGYHVVGIRHGWLGAMSIVRDEHADNSEHFQILTEEIVN